MDTKSKICAAIYASFLSTTALAQDANEEVSVLERIFVDGSQIDLQEPYAGGQVATGGRAGILGNVDYSNLPFSGTSYTSELIQNQQSDGVGDVLLNDPTVRVAQGFGNFQDVYIIRGFPTFSDDVTYNGLFGIVPRQFIAAPLVERVEVLRGANTFVNGAAPGNSGIGGTVNIVPKRGPEERIRTVTLGYESDGTFIGTLDYGERFGELGEWGVRFGATTRTGNTGVNNEERDLAALNLGVDFNGDIFRFNADLGYQDNRLDSPRPQVTPTGAVPTPPDASTNYAQPFTFSEEQQLFFTARGELDLAENITAWAAGGFRLGDEQNDLVNPNVDAAGNLEAFRFVNTREDTVLTGDAGIRSEFDTGDIGHTLIASVSATSFEFDNAFAFGDFFNLIPLGTLSNPIVIAPPPTTTFVGGILSDPITTEETRTTSVAISDTLSFLDETVLLTIGGRWQRIEQQTFNASTGALESDITGEEITPVIGLVIKPTEAISLYANYAESLQRGEIAPQTVGFGGPPVTNAGEVLDPFISDQYEFGVKYDGGNFGVELGYFSITQQSTIFVGNTFTANGEQENSGVEFTFFGVPTEGLRILGGATWIDAELTNTQGGINQGNTAVGVPDFQANLGIEYDIPSVEGLTVDGRIIHTGSQFVDTANAFEVDSWTRVDLGVRYETEIEGRRNIFRARVENVADEAYFASVGGFPGANYLVQGDPRTVTFSWTTDF
ncbi:MAG: TonB-dependent receptor [Chloroflexota bacterium]